MGTNELRLFGASARWNVPDPTIKNGLIPPEIERHLGQSRTPFEPFAEKQVRSHFLDPDEHDLKGPRGCRAAAGVDGKDSYVLCEINVSSVFPFPEQAPPEIARLVMARLHSNKGRDMHVSNAAVNRPIT